MNFGKIKEFFKSVSSDEAEKIEEGERLKKIAEEAMKGDKASSEALEDEKEVEKNTEEKE